MRFGLIIRGQYPQGDDMRVRLKEDLDAARRAEELGYDLIAKGSHYSSHPFQYIQQIPYLCQVALVAPEAAACVRASCCCRCTARCMWPRNWPRWMSCATAS